MIDDGILQIIYKTYGITDRNRFFYASFEDIKKEPTGTILFYKEWETFSFRILRGPTSPTAYIGVTDDYPFYGKHYDDLETNGFFSVHNYLTFSASARKSKTIPVQHLASDLDETNITEEIEWLLGWDYSHWGDQTFWGLSKIPEGRRGALIEWTVTEILYDNINMINKMLTLNDIIKDDSKNTALLNIKNSNKIIRDVCRRKLKKGK